MATTAAVSQRLGTLTVTADADGGDIVLGRTAAGELLVDEGATRVKGGKAGVANIERIVVQGGAGDDDVTLDFSNGGLPAIAVAGGGGLDTLALVGSAVVDIFEIGGTAGSAGVVGQVGAVSLAPIAASGVETVVFRPGAGGDEVIVGNLAGSGVAAVEVHWGSDGANDVLGVLGAGGGSLVLGVAGGVASVTGATVAVTATGVEAGDRFALTGTAASEVIDARGVAQRVDMIGYAGADTLLGGGGNDALQATDGNDVVAGGAGADLVSLGDGDDRALWSVGDGSDFVTGGAGSDRLEMAGSAVADVFGLAMVSGGLVASHGGTGASLNVDGAETLRIAAGAGADSITIGSLAGSGVSRVEIDLGSDAAADHVAIAGLVGSVVIDGAARTYTTSAGVQIIVTSFDAGTDSVTPLLG